ncbi:sensor histidine kinase [Pseudonocardia sp. DSM 110487]|uniref:sensor histidine kinase n=1 Tax=Pseudonocardia sp. DSM 110487 TaxID=2865833 RepID=UPI0021051EFB|nr:sensor histidine kinase [Pseudonocardia sp. DSM 110487]
MTSADERVPPVVVDALFGTAVALGIALVIAAARGGDRPPDLGAYLFAAGFGLLMLLRRRTPRTVLVLTTLGLFAYYAFDYPPIGIALPVVTALFSAADLGRTRWAVGTGVVLLVVSFYFRIREGDSLGALIGYEAVSNIALIAAATALGYSVRSRREIARLTAVQLEREAEWRVQRERERISRDLHDTVGHTMSVISLQAGVAAEAVEPGGPAAQAIERIRAASGQTLRDLRSMVRLLRTPDGTLEVLSLAAVPDLVDATRGVGLEVTTRIDVDGLTPQADAAAYRIVQEALTNVVKHAGARHVEVVARLHEGVLHVRVSDDGRGSTDPADGHGLAGMAERVRLLGGTLETRSGDGFTVEARIPARPAA